MALILIIDDDQSIRYLERITLNAAGFRVVEAANGREALEILNSEDSVDSVDLILSDIHMPDINGITFKNTLNLNPRLKDIPVIFVSAMNDKYNRGLSSLTGAVEFIPKPFETTKLVDRIYELLPDTAVDEPLGECGQIDALDDF